MNLRRRLDAWLGERLANRVTFNALLLAMGLALVLGVISFLITQHLIRQRLQDEINHASEMVAHQMEAEINRMMYELETLAGNPMVSNALLDSGGRDIYLRPFMQGYRFSSESAGLCVNDFLGRALACTSGTSHARLSFQGVPWLSSVMEEKKTYTTIINLDGSRLFVAMPVISPATGLPEGMLTATANIQAMLKQASSFLPGNYVFRLHSRGGVLVDTSDAKKRMGLALGSSESMSLTPPLHALGFSVQAGDYQTEALSAMVWLAFAYLLVVLLTLPLVYWAARRLFERLTGQISHLSNAADRIANAESGALEWRGEAKGNDEISMLTRSFGKMLERLRDAQAHLEERVDDRTRALQLVVADLKAARDEADRANRAKSQFLSSMSHELRTPINAILGYAQLFEMDTRLNSVQRENIREIRTAGDHLMQLINEVLDLARVESGKLEIVLEDVGLEEVIEECLRLSWPLASRHGIEIERAGSQPELPKVRADRTRLKQVLLNLISNAIKYNKKGGSVRISTGHEPNGMVRVTVSDTGQGISPERLGVIFEPFNRAGHESGSVEGTGIGLTISRQLIVTMGGTIDVKSTLGEGSVFWIDLPAGDAKGVPVQDEPVERTNKETGKNSEPGILYIEDTESNIKLVETMLGKRPQYQFNFATEPRAGLEMARNSQPSLILLDINLPDMDGYQVLKELRSSDETRAIPVLAITANAIKGERERGLEAGFDDYLTKPLNVHDFLEKVDFWMGREHAG